MTLLLTILKVIFVFVGAISPAILGGMVGSLWRRMKAAERKLAKADADIITLHKNQRVLVSSLKTLYGKLRKYDKSINKNQVRLDEGEEKQEKTTGNDIEGIRVV